MKDDRIYLFLDRRLGQFTHDSLSTVAGILEAEVAILDDLNALSPGIAQATLTILELAS